MNLRCPAFPMTRLPSLIASPTPWSHSTATVFTYSNAEAARTLGREREVLVGTHMWTEFPHLVG